MASVIVLVTTLFAAVPATAAPLPRVVGGEENPPLAAAAVAIQALDRSCSGTLWRPRIIITTDSCVHREDAQGRATAVPPDRISLWPPGADASGPASPVRVVKVLAWPSWRYSTLELESGSAWNSHDIAYLFLSEPLGTPAWTRMATTSEVEALTWNQALATFVGYGQTSVGAATSGDGRAPLPHGFTGRLDKGFDFTSHVYTESDVYDDEMDVFRILGNGSTGPCPGDEGGPWMVQVGKLTLFLGPLSDFAGRPCAKQVDKRTYSSGGAASGIGPELMEQMRMVGETPDIVPTTCARQKGRKPECRLGRAWSFEVCSAARTMELWRVNEGKRTRIATMKGGNDWPVCPEKRPYGILFRSIQMVPDARFEVVTPKQRGVSREIRKEIVVSVRQPQPSGP